MSRDGQRRGVLTAWRGQAETLEYAIFAVVATLDRQKLSIAQTPHVASALNAHHTKRGNHGPVGKFTVVPDESFSEGNSSIRVRIMEDHPRSDHSSRRTACGQAGLVGVFQAVWTLPPLRLATHAQVLRLQEKVILGVCRGYAGLPAGLLATDAGSCSPGDNHCVSFNTSVVFFSVGLRLKQ